MEYLSAEDLLRAHARVIEATSGSPGLREPGLLQSIAAKPSASFGGEELYPDIFLKAAVLLEAVANYHVFIDGNKRTALAAAFIFLDLNGFLLTASNADAEETILKVATKRMRAIDIADWLRENCESIE